MNRVSRTSGIQARANTLHEVIGVSAPRYFRSSHLIAHRHKFRHAQGFSPALQVDAQLRQDGRASPPGSARSPQPRTARVLFKVLRRWPKAVLTNRCSKAASRAAGSGRRRDQPQHHRIHLGRGIKIARRQGKEAGHPEMVLPQDRQNPVILGARRGQEARPHLLLHHEHGPGDGRQVPNQA